MTTLGYTATDDFDLLSLIADDQTSLGKPFADRFRDACKAVADANGGWIDPNLVRARMLAVEDFSPKQVRQYSGLWSHAAGRNGYLDVPDRFDTVPIDPSASTRNGAKSLPRRRWRGWGVDA